MFMHHTLDDDGHYYHVHPETGVRTKMPMGWKPPVAFEPPASVVGRSGDGKPIMGKVMDHPPPVQHPAAKHRSVTQDWLHALPYMQQTVLLTAVRGPDGVPKYNPIKFLLRWYRRCILFSALDGRVMITPYELGGGSFTGPSIDQPRTTLGRAHDYAPDWEREMDRIVNQVMREIDIMPHHFWMHLVHAVEIIGYKHPDQRIRQWWAALYIRLVHDLHLFPESEEQLDKRLGDDASGWLERADRATID